MWAHAAEVDVAGAVPRVVVALVDTDRRAVEGHRLLEVVIRRVLVAAQRVRVREVGLHLWRETRRRNRQVRHVGVEMAVAPRPVEGCTWIARWKNLRAVSCSFWREKQLPTTQHV